MSIHTILKDLYLVQKDLFFKKKGQTRKRDPCASQCIQPKNYGILESGVDTSYFPVVTRTISLLRPSTGRCEGGPICPIFCRGSRPFCTEKASKFRGFSLYAALGLDRELRSVEKPADRSEISLKSGLGTPIRRSAPAQCGRTGVPKSQRVLGA